MDRLHLHKYDLFKGLSQGQLTELNTIAEEIHVAENFVIMTENEHCDYFYVLCKGTVEVSKKDELLNQSQLIAHLKHGAIIGEISLLDEGTKSASVHTITTATLIKISKTKLKNLSHEHDVNFKTRMKRLLHTKHHHKSIYQIIIENLGKTISKRIRNSNDLLVEKMRKELEISKERVAMGHVVINTIASLCLYVWITHIILDFKSELPSTSFISLPLLAIMGIAIFIMMKKSGYPLSLYGLTTKNWKKSLIEASYLTLILCVLTVLCKEILITSIPAYIGKSLFSVNTGVIHSSSMLFTATIIVLYFVFVPLQELIIRGALQSSFAEFLVGPYKVFWAILLSNFFFSIIHLHLSIVASMVVFVPGLAWGWLYSRHRTLVGVTASHLVLGFWALYVVGLF